MSPVTLPPPSRIDWLDNARGIGIVLVVIGHALGGLIDSSLGPGQYAPRQAFFLIYTFHMPLFFLLSGLLVSRRLEKGAKPFLMGLLPTIVVPYFIWSAVQAGVIHALGTLVNSPSVSLVNTLVSLPWSTVSQFWFLYALFWMHVLATVLLPRIGAEGLVLVALALKALMLVIALPVAAKLVCNHMLFYAIGVWLRPDGVERLVISRAGLVRALLLPALTIALLAATLLALPQFGADLPLAVASSPEIANLSWRFPVMACAVAGTFAVLGLAASQPDALARLFAHLGKLTMPIFVLHVFFIAGTRIVLIKSGLVTSFLALLPLLILAGLIGPLIAERIIRPFKYKRWIGF